MGVTPKSPSRQVDSTNAVVAGVVLDAVACALQRLPPSPSGELKLCVGLSGGVDSVVLLHALCRLRHEAVRRFSLSALHVHHGLSSSADAWAAFCERLCQQWVVPLRVCQVAVPRHSGEGLEGAARRVRHAQFAASEADWIVLAQHRGDQAETLLLNLLRGAGVAGAAAMLPMRPGRHGGAAVLRPLLAVPRDTLLDYARQHGLAWVEDESNADTALRRNFLRHEIMPRLAQVFPGSEAALSRATSRFAEAESLLDELACLDEASTRRASGRIGVEAFNALPAPRARNLFRLIWRRAGFRAPEQRWMDEALAQLADVRAGAETCVATSEGALHVYRGEMYLVAAGQQAPAPCQWQGEECLPWGQGRVRFVSVPEGGIAPSLLVDQFVRLQCRQGGEMMRLAPGRPRRRLRNLLQEAAIPPWVRMQLPCLWIGDELAWVGGLGVDAKYSGNSGLLPIWEMVPSDHCNSGGRLAV